MKAYFKSKINLLGYSMFIIVLTSCHQQNVKLYEFDELYTGPGDTYISDYVPPSVPVNGVENAVDNEEEYVSNANRNQSSSPWSDNGWGNSGYGNYNYGTFSAFNCGASMMWMPYWAYSPVGFYSSPYAYNAYGGNNYTYYNPYYSSYGNPYLGYDFSNSTPVIYGSRQPLASATGTSSSYSGGRFYLGQNRQAALQKPKPLMNTPKPNQKIPSGKAKDIIARSQARPASRTSGVSRGQEKPRTTNNFIERETTPSTPTTNPRPSREDKPRVSEPPSRQTRPIDRQTTMPAARPAAPTRPSSPERKGRP